MKRHFIKKFIQTIRKDSIKNNNIIKDSYTIVHGHYKYDGYNSIKTNKYEQNEIIKNENEIYKKWQNMFNHSYREWEAECYSKSVELVQDQGEEYGEYIYYNVSAREGYDILKRKNKNKDEIVLDLITIPFLIDITNTNLKAMRISKNHKYVSFVVDLKNNEKYSGGIYDIENKKYYAKRFDNVSSIEFSLDENSIYYVENNYLNRPCKIYHHFLEWSKNNLNQDKLIFEEKRDDIYIETSPTKDNKYLIINSLTKDDSQISILDLHDNNRVIELFKRKQGIKHFIEHAGDSFFILSNLKVESEEFPEMSKNENYKLFTVKDSEIKKLS
jgi:protease II